MAIIANTFQTFQAKGNREDLTDVIWNISPYDTPFVSAIERAKAKATLHEWQTDALASANTSNFQIQGDDVSSFDAVTATVRLTNNTQISNKTLIVSRTQETVDKAGRKSEVALQLAKKGKELKIDIEAILSGTNVAKTAGSTSAAAKTASVLSWLKTNTDKEAGGSDPSAADGTGTRTDSGTTRSFLESQLKSVLKGIYTNSGEGPDMVLVPPAQKQVASTFTGNATRMVDAADKKLVAAIDVYTGDFGSVQIVPSRFMRSRDVLVLNTSLWALAWLDPIRQSDLAKTGDTAAKKLVVGEYALEARNEKGSGGIFDIA